MSNTTPPEISTTLCNTDITIRQECAAHPSTTWGKMRYHHTIGIIIAGECPATFDYYTSVNDFQAHKDTLSETDLLTALECILGDAIAGTYDCKEFFAEFGYEDPCEGIKAWQGCVKTFEMLRSVGISEDVLYDMSNEIEDMPPRR